MELNNNIFQVCDYTLETITFTKYNYKGVAAILYPYKLQTGILYLSEDLKEFNGGFIFKDNYNNLYVTYKKKIYFNNGDKFEGDFDKPAYSLFEGFDEFEIKFKNIIIELKKDINEEKKKKIKNEFIKELKAKLENFDINNVILKNGKLFYSDIEYDYIHDNIIEYFWDNEKYYESDNYFQEIDNEEHIINIMAYGNYKNFEDNYEGEDFYNVRIGKGKEKDDNNNKFFFFQKNLILMKV